MHANKKFLMSPNKANLMDGFHNKNSPYSNGFIT